MYPIINTTTFVTEKCNKYSDPEKYCQQAHGSHFVCEQSSGDCICETNYYGTKCDIYCKPESCSNHGSCGAGGCICDFNYYGSVSRTRLTNIDIIRTRIVYSVDTRVERLNFFEMLLLPAQFLRSYKVQIFSLIYFIRSNMILGLFIILQSYFKLFGGWRLQLKWYLQL